MLSVIGCGLSVVGKFDGIMVRWFDGRMVGWWDGFIAREGKKAGRVICDNLQI